MNNNELTELIIKLSSCYGVSGFEDDIAAFCLDKLQAYTSDCYIKNGNVIANFGERKEGKPHLLIDAHLDRVGMIVTYITEDGFLQVAQCGGLDRRILPAQKVIVHTKNGNINGVVAAIPPHLSSGDKKVASWDDIYIDVGNATGIELGDPISFYTAAQTMLGDRICGSALDDRCGIAAILYAADKLANTDINALPYSFTVMLSTQEELGERGACIGAYDINPTHAIAVDVSFAYSQGEKKSKCGEMSKGCMIGVSPSLDKAMSEWFIDYCKEKELPYQIEVMNGTTGTNADRFTVTRKGVKAVTLSIPLRYMHTPCEVISLSDVISTGDLICAYITGGAM